jgi:hypothetical protein
MPHDTPQGWEPEPQKMGNWRAMFEPERGAQRAEPSPAASAEPPPGPAVEDETRQLDLSVYRPWILQRGRSRPAMMLEFRQYEPRSGLWSGWAIAYPHLVGLEYTGDRMLSLDFGTRHIVIEGVGLDELARHIQQGAVVAIHEHAPTVWPERPGGSVVSAIRRLNLSAGAN